MANLFVGLFDDSHPAIVKVNPDTMAEIGSWEGEQGSSSGYLETIVGDGTHIYGIGINGPAKIWKIDPIALTTIATWTGTATQICGAGLIHDGKYLYAVLNDNGASAGKVIKIDAVTMEEVALWQGGVTDIYPTFAAFDGTYIYLTFNSNPVKVKKIDSVTMKTMGVWTGTIGVQQAGRQIVHAGKYVYVALHGEDGGTGIGRVVKINRLTMLQENEWVGASGETALRGLGFDGKYLYACCDADPAKVIQINPDTMKTVLVWTGASQQDRCYDIVFDDTYAYAAMASIYTNGKVIKITKTTMVTSATWTGTALEGKAYCVFYDSSIAISTVNQSVNTYRTTQNGVPIPSDLLNTEKDGTGEWYSAICDQTGRQKVVAREDFGGAIYVNTDIATSDSARRFETISKKLRDVKITVTTNTQLFGTTNSQTYSIAAAGTLQLSSIDISTLYFKNAVAGANGTVDIIGVAE